MRTARSSANSVVTVLVQYSAYGFDHPGYPRWLINALLEWQKNAEPCDMFTSFDLMPIWNKNFCNTSSRDLPPLRVTDVFSPDLEPGRAPHRPFATMPSPGLACGV